MTGHQDFTLEEIAESAGMTARNARAYQARGLLQSPRRDGRTVTYGPEHVARLRLVRALHQRGLSLKVVRDLIDRGDAEAELARLSRERLLATWGREDLIPMLPANVEAFEAAAPGVLQSMAEAGVIVRDGDRWLASSSSLGLTSALLSHGVDLEASGRLAQIAAAAAESSFSALQDALRTSGASDDASGLAVQLVATLYSDVLARRLGLG